MYTRIAKSCGEGIQDTQDSLSMAFPCRSEKAGFICRVYVDTWLKHKTEASGWPANCVTDEQKAEYVKQYEEHEGVKLDKIEKILGGNKLPNSC